MSALRRLMILHSIILFLIPPVVRVSVPCMAMTTSAPISHPSSPATRHPPLATSPARAPKPGAKRCKKVQKSAVGLCSPLLNQSECPFADDISGKFQFLSRFVTICHVLSPLAPLSSADSKWTGPFSTLFCHRSVSSTTHFPKVCYANTENSKWTERIDFFSILVHFEIGSVSHSSLLSLGLARAVSARNFTAKNKNFGKEKVKFWMLYQPLTSMASRKRSKR